MGISEKKKVCNCEANNTKNTEKGTDLLSPIKGKMKVLKKIKRRIGLASRSSSTGGTNNLPPLLFHNVHGDNIRISRDGTTAKRVESFCKGIAFSSRPVKVNEKICIKFLEISNNWSGVIRFGFTYNDPSSLRAGLPKYACPDLTNKPGYWAKALPERFCSQTTVLFYYVTQSGDVHFGINGEEKGIFFGGVETRGPLWALIDVYGNSTAIEFVDIRHQLNNNSRRSLTTTTTTGCDQPPLSRQQQQQQNGHLDDNLDHLVYPMQQMHIQQQQTTTTTTALDNEDLSLPLLRYQPHNLQFNAMMLHRTRGRNVRFGQTRNNAYRTDTEFCQGYVFTGRPLQIGERVVVQVLATEPMFQGCLGLGLTSCDPATLQTGDLPDDSNFLLDRPEYWVLSRDFARNLIKGDEISFCIGHNGEVKISKNGDNPLVIIHVDQTLRLWAFFDIYGSTQRIRVLSSSSSSSNNVESSPVRYVERRVISPSVTTESMNSINSQSEYNRRSSMIQGSTTRVCCVAPTDIQVQPTTNGATVLSLIIPPAHAANLINQQQAAVQLPTISHNHNNHHSHHHQQQQQSSSQNSMVHSPSNIVNNNNNNNSNNNHHGPPSYTTGTSQQQQHSINYNVVHQTTTPGGHVMPAIQQTQMMMAQQQQQHLPQHQSHVTTATGTSSVGLVSPVKFAAQAAATSCVNNMQQQQQQQQHHQQLQQSSNTMMSTGSHTYIEPISSDHGLYSTSSQIRPELLGSTSSSTSGSTATNISGTLALSGGGPTTECTICYEHPIDAVLYMCGHMCMCYKCALQQWQGKGGGHCPLCRALIRDVIRTYKS